MAGELGSTVECISLIHDPSIFLPMEQRIPAFHASSPSQNLSSILLHIRIPAPNSPNHRLSPHTKEALRQEHVQYMLPQTRQRSLRSVLSAQRQAAVRAREVSELLPAAVPPHSSIRATSSSAQVSHSLQCVQLAVNTLFLGSRPLLQSWPVAQNSSKCPVAMVPGWLLPCDCKSQAK